MKKAPGTIVVRFGLTERLYHWAQAVPYVILLVSGALILVQRQSSVDIFSPETLGLIHLACGLALPAAILLAVVGGGLGVHRRNILAAFRWGWSDFRWLAAVPLWPFSRASKAPAVGKFNAGQKLHLLAQSILVPLFVGSGLLMWLRPGILLPWYVHVLCFALVLPLILGHGYLALFHPSTRRALPGIFTGRVDREWARRHHELEYSSAEEEPD